jgi:hypothetical protein
MHVSRLRRASTAGAILTTLVAATLTTTATTQADAAGRAPDGAGDASEVAAYWTEQRMERADARDMVLDERGRAYVRRDDGSLEPHGHTMAADSTPLRAVPVAKPDNPGGGGGNGGGGDGGGGSSDTTGPSITDMDPASEDVIGASHTFTATVSDTSGVKSVTFLVAPDGGQSQSFNASNTGGDTWSVTLEGFTAGAWSWSVEAKDGAKRGGNPSEAGPVSFTVDTGGDGGGDGGGEVVTNSDWTAGGDVQTAAGRIYFEMPANQSQTSWDGYVCSGTAVTDGTSGRSIILTAAHCVYDDVYKAFARNVLFIPDQDGTTGAGTDTDCTNDPLGCWAPSFGVVDDDWTSREFPDNIPWDYAYYVVSDDAEAHTGDDGMVEDTLDVAVPAMDQNLSAPATLGEQTHALGYSMSDDPNFMYCAEPLETERSYGDYWLPSCGLSGGSSGGPWVQPMDLSTGDGPIVSVNSWGYTNQPGMAGPLLAGTSASCLFTEAKAGALEQADRGIAPTC